MTRCSRHGRQTVEAAAACQPHQQRLGLVVLGVRGDDRHRTRGGSCARDRRAAGSAPRARHPGCRCRLVAASRSASCARGRARAASLRDPLGFVARARRADRDRRWRRWSFAARRVAAAPSARPDASARCCRRRRTRRGWRRGSDASGANSASSSSSRIGSAASSGGRCCREADELSQVQPILWRSDLARIFTFSGALGNRVDSSPNEEQAASFWPSRSSDMASFNRLSAARALPA